LIVNVALMPDQLLRFLLNDKPAERCDGEGIAALGDGGARGVGEHTVTSDPLPACACPHADRLPGRILPSD
jgi:hypothetical protein